MYEPRTAGTKLTYGLDESSIGRTVLAVWSKLHNDTERRGRNQRRVSFCKNSPVVGIVAELTRGY